MKIGVSLKIDVSKIDKARLFKGAKGTYLDLTMFIDPDAPGQFGDHGTISQSVTKEERDAKVQLPILGNGKVFYQERASEQQAPPPQQAPPANDLNEDIPW